MEPTVIPAPEESSAPHFAEHKRGSSQPSDSDPEVAIPEPGGLSRVECGEGRSRKREQRVPGQVCSVWLDQKVVEGSRVKTWTWKGAMMGKA